MGVGGSAQARAVLRLSTSSIRWEQKIFCHILKNIAINAFVAWCLTEKKGMLRSKELFHNLNYFRNLLNIVGSLADFMYDISTKLLAYADELRKAEDESDIGEEFPDICPEEVVRLRP